jgi:hypothetical protein
MSNFDRCIVVCGLSIRKKWLRYLGYHTLPQVVDHYELWDLSPFCDKHANEVSFDDEINGGDHIRVLPDPETFRYQLRKVGANPNPTYVFPLSTRPQQVVDIWQASQGTNLQFCIKEHKDHPPNPFRPVSLWGKGRRVKHKMQWTLKNAELAYRYGRPYRAFYATPQFIGKWGTLDGFAPREYIHTLNYDKVLDLDRQTPRTESYAVYIDQNLPGDHQVQVEGEKMISEELFWDRIRGLFERLKTETGIEEVVVCAHPNRSQASLDRISSFCRVVQFETEKWIRDCALVIAHASTALDFAVIFEKPLCFVELPEMRRNQNYAKMIRAYAKKLGRQVNVLSDPLPSSLDWGRDDAAYTQFKTKFIKHPGTPEVNSWKYIVRFLRETSAPIMGAEA